MLYSCLALVLIWTLTEGAFTPSVTLDCLPNDDIEVDITSASTSGKVALYVGSTLCHEVNTVTTSIKVTFTPADCAATYPARETEFHIYVTEGATLEVGNPDKVYAATCHTDDSETYSELAITTSSFVTDTITAVIDIDITDISDVSVSDLTIGDTYKFKLKCQTAYENDFDFVCTKITVNSIVTILENGCTNYESIFPTFSQTAQCSLEATFTAFGITASTHHSQTYVATVDVCAGTCPTPANCASGPAVPAWGRRKRDISDALINATIEEVRLYKTVRIHPRPVTESPDESVITPPVIDLVGTRNDFQEKSQDDLCISGPIVLGTLCFLCFVIVAASVIDILLFLAFRKARNKEMDMHNESNSAVIKRSSAIHEGR